MSNQNLTVLTIETLNPLKDNMRKVGLSDMDILREFNFAMQIFNGSGYMQKLDKSSVYYAVQNTAFLGLTLNPVAQEAALIPRKGKVILEPMYRGLTKLLYGEKLVSAINTQIIHAKDKFEMDLGNSKKPITHSPCFADDRGAILGAYTMFTTIEGFVIPEFMTLKELHKIRARSESYKTFLSKGYSCAWTTDEEEMYKKTVLKRGIKRAPRSTNGNNRLNEAIAITNDDFEHEATPRENLENDDIMEQIINEVDTYVFSDKQKLIKYCQQLKSEKDFKTMANVLDLVKIRKEVNGTLKDYKGEDKDAKTKEVTDAWKIKSVVRSTKILTELNNQMKTAK